MTDILKTKVLPSNNQKPLSVAANKSYSTITESVTVTVSPEFIDCKFNNTNGDVYIWAYHIKIHNERTNSIKLINRYWKIIDEHGVIQEVNGEGVIGEQPVIQPNSSYQYSSGVHLRYPSGIMTGHYQMQNVEPEFNNSTFNIKIPTFSLDVPGVSKIIN